MMKNSYGEEFDVGLYDDGSPWVRFFNTSGHVDAVVRDAMNRALDGRSNKAKNQDVER